MGEEGACARCRRGGGVTWEDRAVTRGGASDLSEEEGAGRGSASHQDESPVLASFQALPLRLTPQCQVIQKERAVFHPSPPPERVLPRNVEQEPEDRAPRLNLPRQASELNPD